MKLSYSLIAVLFITLFSGCKQDFDVTADYKEIPVVYGLFNQQDNKHYVRIQKGYLIDGNALLAAGVPDSVYYPDVLNVTLTPYTASGTQQGAIIHLTRVDGNTVSLPKDSGLFANTPNWLYTFTGSLDANKNYKLTIINTSNGDTIINKKIDGVAGVTLVKDFQIFVPTKGLKMNLQNVSASHVRWSDAENAGIYDLTVTFFYTEYRLSDGTFYKNDSINVPIFKSDIQDYAAGHTNDIELTSDMLLHYLAANVKSDIDVIREFDITRGMKFKFAAGGTELAKFVNSRAAQGGLASNEALPPYTNIDKGVGLLSSRYFKQVDSVLFTNNALDSLACSDITRGLRFKNHSGAICQ